MRQFQSFDSYRAAWDGAFTSDPAVPLNLDIELASVCNLACPFCFWGEGDFNEEMKKPADDGKPMKRLMPTLMAMELIDQAAKIGIPALKFNWRGESTIHPDYGLILNYASKKKSTTVVPDGTGQELEGFAFQDILVNTNANCKDQAIDGLMAATKCMVSLDSMVPETYKKMRVNGDLGRAKEVIHELIRRKHPNLWVRRVMTKENANEPFAKQVREEFGPWPKISEHACFDRNADEHHQVNDPVLWKDRTYCGYPSQRMMVASYGLAYPCCVDYDGTMVMGDLRKSTILDVWHGEKFRNLRATLRSNDLANASKTCQKCTSWMAYKSPNRELVKDKEVAA